MAVKTTTSSPTAPSSRQATVGASADAASTGTDATTGTAAGTGTTAGTGTAAGTTSAPTNPIGTGQAKLLQGDTQEQDDALQLLKYDAYDVSLAEAELENVQSSNGSSSEIAAAQTKVDTAKSVYETDLTNGSAAYGLSSARIYRYLTGGEHPVPDNSLIPTADGDLSSFIKTLADDSASTADDASIASTDSTASTDGTTAASSIVDASASADYTALMAQYKALQSQAYATQDVTTPTLDAFATAMDDYIAKHVTDPDQAAALKKQADDTLASMGTAVAKQQATNVKSNDQWDSDRITMEALLTQVAPEGADPVYSPVSAASSSSTTSSGTQSPTSSDTQSAASSGTQTTASSGTQTTASSAGAVTNVDKTLTAAQQQHLSDSSKVLSTSNITDDEGNKVPITSGDVSADFKLYPSGAPAAGDINQLASTDCYWLSALGSMASTPEGQKTLQNAITGPASNGDYTVTLYAPSGTPVDIVVNPNNLPVNPDGTPAFNSSANQPAQANWVNLMEAAYAKYNDVYHTNTDASNKGLSGYDAIMQDGVADVSFNYALTGQQSTARTLQGQSSTDVATVISQGLASGKPIEVYNYDLASAAAQQVQPDSVDAEGHTIIGSHAYSVVGISADGKTVTVRNPWGANFQSRAKGQNADGSFTMSMDDFKSTFEQINV